MDPERWDRLQRLFHEALDRPPAERDAFLEAAEPDAALRAEVRTLLQADADPHKLSSLSPDRIGELLDAAAGTPGDLPSGAAPPSLKGRRIGPYTVIRRIGQGGMGAVYLAEREDVEKEVALKLVRGALGAPELVQRFLQERRVLARLDHPNIARLLDAGVTDDETPFFAMEYVEGEPITDWCAARSLPVAARLRLFRAVCDAVSYAHASLVVHRDIKPSNVMVATTGQVKLLDFGIAKLLGDDDATLTRTGVRVMSPAYAAPEQVAGEPVTTATDVYALGALLYELLTGETATTGGGRLLGDLDAICQRALDPEPHRRYRSAEQLLDDITRHLSGLPVEARLPTFRYRAGKFLRRHAAAVSGAIVLALSLGGGLGAAVWQGQRAEEARIDADAAREDAERALTRSQTVTSFLTDLFRAADPREAQGEEVTAVELVERGVARIDALTDDPPLQAELLQTLATVNLELGRYPDAEALVRRAVGIRRTLPPDEAFVTALNGWGSALIRLGLPDSAAATWEEALQRGGEVLGEEHPTVVAIRSNLAMSYGRLGRDREAEEMLRQVIDIDARTLGPDHPDRSSPLNNLGIQLTHQGRHDEGIELLREGLRVRRLNEGDDDIGTGMLMDNLGMALREAGRYDEAEPLMRRGLAVRKRLLGEEHRFYGESLFALGTLLALRAGPGDLEEGETLLRQGLDIYRTTLGPDHPGTAYLLHSLGILEENRGDLRGAEARFREALAIRRGAARDNPMVTVYTMSALARVLLARGSAEALPIAREAAELASDRLRAGYPNRSEAEAQLALALAHAGDPAAPDRFAGAASAMAAVIGPDHPRVVRLCADAARLGIAGPC